MYTTTKTSSSWQVSLPIQGNMFSYETKLRPKAEHDTYAVFDLIPLVKEATSLAGIKDFTLLESLISYKEGESASLYEKIISVEDALTVSLFNALWAEVGEAGGLNEVALKSAYLALENRLEDGLALELAEVFEACGFSF